VGKDCFLDLFSSFSVALNPSTTRASCCHYRVGDSAPAEAFAACSFAPCVFFCHRCRCLEPIAHQSKPSHRRQALPQPLASFLVFLTFRIVRGQNLSRPRSQHASHYRFRGMFWICAVLHSVLHFRSRIWKKERNPISDKTAIYL